jgi:hypothetical protein
MMKSKTLAAATDTRSMPEPEAIKQQRMDTKRWFEILVALTVVLTVALIVWVFILAPIDKATVAKIEASANLAVVLAPVLAAAAGVERMLETVFNIMEGSWKSMVAYLGRGLRWLNSAEVEVDTARQWLADVSIRYNDEMRSLQLKPDMSAADLSKNMQTKIAAAKTLVDLAEKRLTDAEKNLAAATSSDSYRSAKAAVSIVLGLMIGLIVATLGQLQMFAMLGIGVVPARVDVLITGLIIGTGSYPVHSLVGILQQSKDTLDSVKGFFNRSAPQGRATEQSLTTTQPSNIPGEQPVVRQAVIATTTAQTTEETPNS